MTRGQRDGQLTKANLIDKLCPVVLARLGRQDDDDAVSATRTALHAHFSVGQLYGFARGAGLLTATEDTETCPKTTSTVPCYLFTHVGNERLRQAIDGYVVAASRLYKRGSDIVAGLEAALPRSVGVEFDVFSAAEAQPLAQLAALLDTTNDLKQCFLPERWPTDEVPLNPLVEQFLERNAADLQHLLPDWRSVMGAAGWDNVLNRLESKYLANVKVMVTSSITQRCADYVVAILTRRHAFNIPTESSLAAFQAAVVDSLTRRPRPLVVHNDEYAVLCRLRSEALACPEEGEDSLWYPPKRPRFSSRLLRLYLAISSVLGREALPAVRRGRHFCYLDAKVLEALVSRAF